MDEQINALLELLNDNDKIIFKYCYKNGGLDYLYKTSIFCNNYNRNQLEKYNYQEFCTDENIYYLNIINIPIFINYNKQIISSSFQCFYNINHAIIPLIHILKYLKNIDLNNIEKIEVINKNIITIQKFNNLYGHFKDELFCLYDFYELFSNKNDYIPLINYNYDFNNYNELTTFLFENNYFNPFLNEKILKINKLIIIEHHYSLDTFHLFPINSKNKILSNIKVNSYIENKYSLFLTRSESTHRKRLFNNIIKFTTFLEQKNFVIINPENITLEETIKIIRNSNLIIITWGSALVNLIYAEPKTKIFILKSINYNNENISIFRNLIKNYNLNISIINCDNDDNIDLERCAF
jgi:hypothetical protein